MAEIADLLTSHAELRLAIEGHTDNVGDAVANQALSAKRAAAVRAHLMEHHGIAAGRLEAAGFGASRPAAPNDSEEGRGKNRRVELVKM
jgi:outer membrane protein OmpA-like peptidoglycan-associated protein